MNRNFSRITRHWKALLALNILIFSSAYAIRSRFPSETWIANAKLVIPETSSQLEANLGALGSVRNENLPFSQLVNPRDLQISVLTSDVVMRRILESDPYQEDFETLNDFKGIFEISEISGTTGFQVTTSADNDELALQRLSSLIDTYYERLYELRTSEGSGIDRFTEERISQAERQLSEAEARLLQFKEASGVVNADLQIENLLTSIDTLKSEYDQAVLNAVNNASQVRVLEERTGLPVAQATDALELGQNPNYQFTIQQLTEISAELAAARSAFTEESFQVRQLLREQQGLDEQLSRIVTSIGAPSKVDPTVASGSEGSQEIIQEMILLDSLASGQRSRAVQVQNILQQLNNSLTLLPEAQAQLQRLQRDYDLAEGVYQGVVAQAQQASINAFTAYPGVQLLDPPRVDPEPSSWSLFIINAAIASVLGSVALFLLLESRNPRSTFDEEIESNQDNKVLRQ